MKPTETLPTGCVREKTDGRGAYELMSPFVLERDAKLFEWGAEHRGNRNWEKGCPFSRCVQSIWRHLVKLMMREPDEEHDDNLAAIRFWAGAIMHYQEMIKRGLLPPTLDDLPHYEPKKSYAEAVREANKFYAEVLREAGKHADVALGKIAKSQVEAFYGHSFVAGRRPIVREPLRIYVAGPYSAPTAEERERNRRRAEEIGVELAKLGHDVHIPHAATAPLDGHISYGRFMRLDLGILTRWSNALFYIATSPGAARECDRAIQKGHVIYTRLEDVPIVWDVWLEGQELLAAMMKGK